MAVKKPLRVVMSYTWSKHPLFVLQQNSSWPPFFFVFLGFGVGPQKQRREVPEPLEFVGECGEV